MSEITRAIAWILYTAIENYRQAIERDYCARYEEWLDWIQSIRLAKMNLIKEVE